MAQQINQFCVTTVSKASLLTQGSGAEESSFLSWFAGSAVGGRDGWKGGDGGAKRKDAYAVWFPEYRSGGKKSTIGLSFIHSPIH